MKIFLVHIRDPQFYGIPAKMRAKNGCIQVMGFPPIGIMSLSAVLKRAGHECFMFDQANPETPNEVILEEIRRKKPDLVGLSFLSTTSYPYAKILARQIRAADSNVKIAFGGVFDTLNSQLVKLQVQEVDFVCRGDGEHFESQPEREVLVPKSDSYSASASPPISSKEGNRPPAGEHNSPL